MNHLAHFLLCPADDDLRAGTLIADFARGNDLCAFPPQVELGIRLHRRIDALVDSSPEVAGLKPLVEAPLRRYAGILFDVFFDYALIHTWHAFHAGERSAFGADVYSSLARTEPAMPQTVRAVSQRMRQYDALSSCASHEGCARTLTRIAMRLKRPVALGNGIGVLMRHETRVIDACATLYPALQRASTLYLEAAAAPSRARPATALA